MGNERRMHAAPKARTAAVAARRISSLKLMVRFHIGAAAQREKNRRAVVFLEDAGIVVR
jgi:hypothetical protein